MIGEKDILEAQSLTGKPDNTPVAGLFIVKDYQKRETRNGSYYIEGTLEAKGVINFKAWGNSDAFVSLDGADYRGQVCYGGCSVNLYGGSLSLIMNSVKAVSLEGTDISESSFYTSKYDGDKYFSGIVTLLKKNLADPSTLEVFKLLFSDPDILERFRVEFAAKNFHDNCKSGLVAHTYKVLYISKVLKLYPEILKTEGSLDLILLGCAIHDIGKVFEYTNGSILGVGKIVSHHTFGVEILLKHKQEIVDLKGEEFFYRLCAIVEQHHGEYEEEPRTIEAYIIHLIDKFESSLQLLDQKLEGFDKNSSQVQINNFKLC